MIEKINLLFLLVVLGFFVLIIDLFFIKVDEIFLELDVFIEIKKKFIVFKILI